MRRRTRDPQPPRPWEQRPAPPYGPVRVATSIGSAHDRAIPVNAMDLGRRTHHTPSLARRAVDLSRDVRVPTGDGAEHLARLAMGRRDALEAALAELDRLRPSSDVVHAHLLLTSAIDLVERDRRHGRRARS